MKKILYLVLIIMSCTSKIENNLIGFWDIQSIYFNNENIALEILTSSLDFNRNRECSLPIRTINERNLQGNIGKWKLTQTQKNTYLEIESSNVLFNRKFKIEKFNKQKDIKTGYKFIEMTIVADSLKIDLIRKWDVQ